jgi:hypothetical protein
LTIISDPENISDDEIVAATVRYARSAPPGRRAVEILASLKADFPNEPEARIRRCMGTAAQLLDAQHS